MSFRFFSLRFLVYFIGFIVFNSYCFAQENKESKVFDLFNTLRSDLQVEKTKIELFESYFTQLNNLLKDDSMPKTEKLEKLTTLVGNLESLLNDDYFFSGLTIDLKEKVNLLARLLVVFIKAENLDWEKIEKDYTSVAGALDAITKFLDENEFKIANTQVQDDTSANQNAQTKGIEILVNNQEQKQLHINRDGVAAAQQTPAENKANYKKIGNRLLRATISTLDDIRNGGAALAFAKNLLGHSKKSEKHEVKV